MSESVQDGGELRLTDEGIEMPEMLKGYVGQFEIKTNNITAQMNTTEAGLPEDDISDVVWATYPGSADGDYNNDIEHGEMVVQARGYPATKFSVIDERDES